MIESMAMPKAENEKKESAESYEYDVSSKLDLRSATDLAQELHKQFRWMVGQAGFKPVENGIVLEVSKGVTREQAAELFDELNQRLGTDFSVSDEEFISSNES